MFNLISSLHWDGKLSMTAVGDTSVCIWNVIGIVLDCAYIGLLILCLKLIFKHRGSIYVGNVTGLTWYLLCTAIMCLFRSLGFLLIPLLHSECSESYSYWQWDIGGAINQSGDVRMMLILLILSSSSSALFFTSYSYLAHSLAKVLDMLTNDYMTNQSNSGHAFFLVMLAQNVCVWLSVFMLWITLMVKSEWALIADGSARFLVSIATLTTGVMFSTHVARASQFLRRLKFAFVSKLNLFV